jgi:hypothetical protein
LEIFGNVLGDFGANRVHIKTLGQTWVKNGQKWHYQNCFKMRLYYAYCIFNAYFTVLNVPNDRIKHPWLFVKCTRMSMCVSVCVQNIYVCHALVLEMQKGVSGKVVYVKLCLVKYVRHACVHIHGYKHACAQTHRKP